MQARIFGVACGSRAARLWARELVGVDVQAQYEQDLMGLVKQACWRSSSEYWSVNLLSRRRLHVRLWGRSCLSIVHL